MKKVLVVAEKPFFVDLLAEHGAATGLFGVLNADNSAKALDIIESILIDVVVADLELPGVDGFELLLAVSQRFPTMPLVTLSSASQKELSSRVETLAALRFHSKPVNLESLINEVCDAMDNVGANQRCRPIELSTTLQLLEACRRTCMLRIKVQETPAGFFYFRDGTLFNAFTPSLKGEEAIFELLRIQGATLGFAKIPDRNIPRTVDADITTVLRRAGLLRSPPEESFAPGRTSAGMIPPAQHRTGRMPSLLGHTGDAQSDYGGPAGVDPTYAEVRPSRRVPTPRKSALEEWHESTASRLRPSSVVKQLYSPDADDGDELLEILETPPRQQRGHGPFVKGRPLDDLLSPELLLPPEDSAISYDIARGARPPAPQPRRAPDPRELLTRKPAPLPPMPPLPPRPTVAYEHGPLEVEMEQPPDLPGVDTYTPLELIIDPPPIELELPPTPLEMDLLSDDELELLDDGPTALLPREITGETGPSKAPPPVAPMPPLMPAAPAPLVHPFTPPTPPAPSAAPPPGLPPDRPVATAPESQVVSQSGDATITAAEPPNRTSDAGLAPAAVAVTSAPAVVVGRQWQIRVAAALSPLGDVVGLRGCALLSNNGLALFSTMGWPVASHEEQTGLATRPLADALALLKAMGLGNCENMGLRTDSGTILVMPLKALMALLPKKAERKAADAVQGQPALLALLDKGASTAMALHRLGQCELSLVELYQETQEEPTWPLLPH